MKKIIKVLSVVVCLSLIMAGCASIVSKSNYPVSINSSPDQASFTITNKNGENVHSGRTPETVTLKSGRGYFKKSEYTVTFSKEGFEDKTATIVGDVDGWFIGNILFGGLIGILIVDPATGAMWKLPEAISASLTENTSASNTDNAVLQFVMISDVPEKYRDQLVRVQ